jgi:putative protease
MKQPQLLAPAGDFASVDAALDHGADAVYVGIGPFNLRAHAPNFLPEDLPELIERIHNRGRLLYFAFNIMPEPERLPEMEQILRTLTTSGTLPDAFIVSDPGVLLLCRQIVPDVALHLSTQTGSFNEKSLCFWKDRGITRVVLPRELNLRQIAGLAQAGILETEVFIHGAMCVSISGRCLLGAYLGGRHPNRGDCPQPCRWRYRISPLPAEENGSPEEMLDVEETDEGAYFLNSRDLCTIEILPSIIRTGVTSLKIEGRNKSAHYVAAVVKTYRAALDTWKHNPETYNVPDEWTQLLESVDHRPYTTGFYNSELQMQEVFTSKASAGSRIVGTVKALLPGGVPVIDVKNSFHRNDSLEVLPVNQNRIPFPIAFTKLADLSGNEMTATPSNRLVAGYSSLKLQVGDMLRKLL